MLKIESKRQGDLVLKGVVTLHLGVNDVPEADWEKVAQDDITRWYVDQGIVKLGVQVPTLEEVLGAGYSGAAARGIVAEQQALAAGKSPEAAHAAARAAVEAHEVLEREQAKALAAKAAEEKAAAEKAAKGSEPTLPAGEPAGQPVDGVKLEQPVGTPTPAPSGAGEPVASSPAQAEPKPEQSGQHSKNRHGRR